MIEIDAKTDTSVVSTSEIGTSAFSTIEIDTTAVSTSENESSVIGTNGVSSTGGSITGSGGGRGRRRWRLDGRMRSGGRGC